MTQTLRDERINESPNFKARASEFDPSSLETKKL
jgi:hypothetical protein